MQKTFSMHVPENKLLDFNDISSNAIPSIPVHNKSALL